MKIQRPGPDSPDGPRVARNCQVCALEFWPRQVDVIAGKGKHCSNNCSSKAFRKPPAPKKSTCTTCGKAIQSAAGGKKFCEGCRFPKKSFTCRQCDVVFVRKKKGASSLFCCLGHARAFAKKTPEERRETRKLYIQTHRALYSKAVSRWRSKLRNEKPDQYAQLINRQYKYYAGWVRTEAGRAISKACRQRRRARLRDGQSPGVSPWEWSAICAARSEPDGRVRCMYCQTPCVPTIEHVVPLARGGWDCAANVGPACRSCNSSKGTKLIHEWPRAKKFFEPQHLAAFAAGWKDQ